MGRGGGGADRRDGGKRAAGTGGEEVRWVGDKTCREGVVWWTASFTAVCLAVNSVCVCVCVRVSRVIQEDTLLTIRSASILTFLHFCNLKIQPKAQ